MRYWSATAQHAGTGHRWLAVAESRDLARRIGRDAGGSTHLVPHTSRRAQACGSGSVAIRHASRRRLWLRLRRFATSRTFDRTTAIRQFFHQLRFDALSVLKGLPFLILLGFGLINLISRRARLSNRLFGTEAHPVTALMLGRCGAIYQFCWR